MSSHVIPPEIEAAWRIVEANTGFNFHENFSAEFARGREELDLLTADVEKGSPNVDKLMMYFKRALELESFEQESLTLSLELYHSVNICVADLEARPEVYLTQESEEGQVWGKEEFHWRHGVLARMAEEGHERQRDYAKNKAKLAILKKMIAERLAYEQLEPSEPSADSDQE